MSAADVLAVCAGVALGVGVTYLIMWIESRRP